MESEEGRARRGQGRSCGILGALERTWAFLPGKWEPWRVGGEGDDGDNGT